MKISICTSGFKDWSLEKVIEWASSLEIDGLELWMGHIERFEKESGPIDKLKEIMDRNGFAVPIISGYTSFSGGFAGEHDLQQDFQTMRKLLSAARQLNCPLVRTFLGHTSSRNTSPEQWGQMLADMEKVMDLADQYETNIAVEIHYNTFIDNTESCQLLLQEMNHPRLKVVFDGANLKVEQIDQIEALPKLRRWVEHVHLKNYHWDLDNFYKTKPKPAFDGDLNNRLFIEELQRCGYSKFVSLEYFGKQKEDHIKKSLTDLKKMPPI